MCPERMTLPRGIVALRAVPSGGEAPQGGGAEPPCVPLRPLEIKEIQRRAFERGRDVERERVAERLGSLVASLESSVKALEEARTREREELASFGVELAVAVAEHLVGTAIRAGTHDVRRLVDLLLEEALPGLGQAPLQLAVNPADLDALGDIGSGKDPRAHAGRIHLVADAELPRAACRIRAGGAEILADPKVRLAAIAEKLRAIAAAERPDA
jgi:flagellar biosynthesis/type III secretory pathway protein FliH